MMALLGYWKYAAILILVATIFGAGWKVRDYQAKAEALIAEKKTLSDLQDALSVRDKKEAEITARASDLETKLAALSASKQKVQIIREKIYAKESVFATCVVPDDGVSFINARIAMRHAPSDPSRRKATVQ